MLHGKKTSMSSGEGPDNDTFALALRRKRDQLKRLEEISDSIVAYVSPGRKTAWVVNGHASVIGRAQKRKLRRIVNVSSPRQLARLLLDVQSQVGDVRTLWQAACRVPKVPLKCDPACRPVGEDTWIKETSKVNPQYCYVDKKLPETSYCTEILAVFCVREYFSDSECSIKKDEPYEATDWLCTPKLFWPK